MRQDEGYSKSNIGGVTKHLCWDGYDIACSFLSPSHPSAPSPLEILCCLWYSFIATS